MNPVIHFEMPYDNPVRLSGFYKAVFGWRMENMGAQMGNYVLAKTVASDSSGRPTKPGAINGGFFEKKPDWPAQHPSVVIGVDDIRAAMARIAECGGQVLGEPMDIPGVGAYVSFTDTEGNRVSLLQPLPLAKPAKTPAAKKKKVAARKPAKKAAKKAPKKAAKKKSSRR
jgi:predicted enzyme related to lactoylglutathione lyase